MIVHSEPSYTIYFGDKQDVLLKPGIAKKKRLFVKEDFFEEGFAKIQKNLKINNLVFLEQVHGTQGACIDEHTPLVSAMNLFAKEGDMIISNRKAVGIGVLSADCLPVILYDSVRHVIAVVHAGWRGSVQSIVVNTIKKMQQQFSSRSKDMAVYLGPSAKVCCYEIKDDVLVVLEKFSYSDQIVRKENGKFYLNVPLMNKFQLIEQGIRQNSIHDEYNECTICNPIFHSYRREGLNAGAQATVVFLK